MLAGNREGRAVAHPLFGEQLHRAVVGACAIEMEVRIMQAAEAGDAVGELAEISGSCRWRPSAPRWRNLVQLWMH